MWKGCGGALWSTVKGTLRMASVERGGGREGGGDRARVGGEAWNGAKGMNVSTNYI